MKDKVNRKYDIQDALGREFRLWTRWVNEKKHEHNFRRLGFSYTDWVDWQPTAPYEARMQRFFCTRCLEIKIKVLEKL